MNKYNYIEADYILINGKIYTMDKYNHIYSNMVIKGNKIVYVGSDNDLNKYIGKNTKVFNLDGKMMLPGFGDSHMHPPGDSLIYTYGVDLRNPQGNTKEEKIQWYYKKIIDYANKNENLNRIYGYGWIPGNFEGIESIKGPKKERLDNLDINKPIILYSYDLHSLWLNSKAFKEFNITKDSSFIDEKIPCKNIIKDDSGELWGTLKEDAFIFVEPQNFTDEQYTKAFEKFQEDMHKFGITNISSVYVNYMSGFMPYKIYKRIIEENKLQLRVAYSENIHPHIIKDNKFLSLDGQIDNLLLKKEESKSFNDYFKVVAGKIFIDGVIDSKTGSLTSPYETLDFTKEINYGYNLWENNKENLRYVIIKLNKNNLQAHFHCIGDNATKFILDIMEEIPSSDRKKYRNIITHLQLIRKRDIKRISKLKLICALQTYWHVKLPNDFEDVEYNALGERAEYEYPLKSLIDEEIIVSGASDYPITEPKVTVGIQRGATRNLCNGEEEGGFENITSIDDDKYLLNKYERASLKDMIKAFTINSAYANFMDDIAGSLEVNKRADFIILNKDLFEVKLIDLHKVEILATFFDGKIVYDKYNNSDIKKN